MAGVLWELRFMFSGCILRFLTGHGKLNIELKKAHWN